MRSRKDVLVLFVGALSVLLVFSIISNVAFAAEEGHGGGKSVWELFKTTGFVGILLVLLSIAGLALTIDYSIHLRQDQLAPPHIIAEVEELVGNGEIEEAANVASADPSYFGKVVGAGLAHAHQGTEEALGGLDTTANEEKFKLDAKVSYLSLVGNLGPLIGLLGTVTGMISSFQKIETTKSPTPADLAAGVYESLVNTTMGLFIGVMFLVAFFIFKNKVTKMTLSVNTLGHELVKRCAG